MVDYFEQVLNMDYVREADVNSFGNFRIPVLLELNKRAT